MAAIEKTRVGFLARVSRPANWAILAAGTIVLSGLLELAGLPAALLLGAMIAAILIETSGGALRVPRLFYYAAQAVIGCMIARVITPAIVGTFLKDWPLLIGVMLVAVVASSFLGWGLGRLRILPEQRPFGGSLPVPPVS